MAQLLDRAVLVEPLHWLLTGVVVTVLWRQWHRRGVRVTGPVVAAVVYAMAAHSLNDGSASLGCGSAFVDVRTLLQPLIIVALYLVLRAVARRSLPPTRVGIVSRAWHPRRLPTTPVVDAPAEAAPAVATRA